MPPVGPLISLLLAASAQPNGGNSVSSSLYTVHDIVRTPSFGCENLAIRDNGQILVTTTNPNASIYQIDPLGMTPPTLIHRIPTAHSANGISEGAPGIFYVASGDINFVNHLNTTPSSYTITELDLRDVHVNANGTLTNPPTTKQVAAIPDGALLNGIDMVHPIESPHLLVADSFRGLIWNVNVANGSVGITLNDTTTRGPGPAALAITGINGLKVFNGSVYYTNTGTSTMWKCAIDMDGNVRAGAKPILVTSEISCDDFAIDPHGNAFVAGPQDILTKVWANGTKEIIAGTLDSNTSSLVGPTAVRFGRMKELDRHSIYVTTDGNLTNRIPQDSGVSRIDLGEHW